MKKIAVIVLSFLSSSVFACGGGEWWDGMGFYNLFKQTNISATEYYPFLRNETSTFYGENYYSSNESLNQPMGNLKLWNEVLKNWSAQEIEKAVYDSQNFTWSGKLSPLEKSVRIYIQFAHRCSEAYGYRQESRSWDYNEILKSNTVDTHVLLEEASRLVEQETNTQLQARYHYQIIRLLHYSKDWSEAITYFETRVKNKFPKNEIYYYTVDQVAGCHYSVENYEKAAYLFTKVFNKSMDRKKSAYLSFNFCTRKNAEGTVFFNGVEDKKDLLLIKSLRDFSDENTNINTFIGLDANDPRVELLFMRSLNNLEREVMTVSGNSLPNKKSNIRRSELLAIAEKQINNLEVENIDFWRISSSYLSYINNDILLAQNKLKDIASFQEQQKVLSVIYEISSWEGLLSPDKENYLYKVLADNPEKTDWDDFNENDLRHFILEKVAHNYYVNNQLAKAFLVHNTIDDLVNVSSLELLNDLETFYHKPNKSKYEIQLLGNQPSSSRFIDTINNKKGVYYLLHGNPNLALVYFDKEKNPSTSKEISNLIFSNNTVECFSCDEEAIMDDRVFESGVFSFIKSDFSIQELTQNLIKLEDLTRDEKLWKAKLANYLLANYYFNISNTGYYRGVLTDKYREHYHHFKDEKLTGEQILSDRLLYNLSGITSYDKRYFHLSDISKAYYTKVISLSSDKELNARCYYLMAKCELNHFYNNGSNRTYEMPYSKYSTFTLPFLDGFDELKTNYSNTKFHDMIIEECSYFEYYSALN